MSESLNPLADFLMELDALKAVQRQTYINGGERRENSAEHSWQLAMACWAFAEHLQDDFDMLKLIQMALVHDLGEIDAGDTFLYSEKRDDAHQQERAGVERLANHAGNPIPNIMPLWDEQEWGESKETQLLKVIDRLLPFLHNMTSEGRAWQKNKVHKGQVIARHAFIGEKYPDIYQWFLQKLDYAVEQGWLLPEPE